MSAALTRRSIAIVRKLAPAFEGTRLSIQGRVAMNRETLDAISRELHRIGLRKEELPGLAMEAGAEREFLRHLEQLPVGASLHDVFPDLPAHWLAGQPETWTTPYGPIGPYDYQELPTGPAVHVQWPKESDPVCLDRLVAAARRYGWTIHGAGFIRVINLEWPTLDGMIILARGTTREGLDEFLEWLDAQPDVTLAGVPRVGDEGRGVRRRYNDEAFYLHSVRPAQQPRTYPERARERKWRRRSGCVLPRFVAPAPRANRLLLPSRALS